MKDLLGILVCLLGVAVGLYLGVYVCLVGGVVQIINSIIQQPQLNALGIAWGVARVLLSSTVGWLSFVVMFSFGRALLD